MNSFDLHMHSIHSSDGEFTPRELIEKAKAANLTTVALSDHNTVKGLDLMIREGKKEGIRVIPAMEFDTLFEGLEVHVLGYGIDYKDNPYFDSLQQVINQKNDDALDARIQKINDYYHMDLDWKTMIKKAGRRNAFTTVVNQFLADPKYQDKPEFQPYLPGGNRCQPAAVNFYWDNCTAGSPCYVRVEYPSLEDTVKRIHDAGGIAIIAHPFKNFYHRDDLLDLALTRGIEGLEAFSNYHDAAMNAYYEDYCKRKNILITCGSDFHGKTKPTIKMGEYGYTKDDGEEILKIFLQHLHLDQE